ncbi:MAG: glycosyltransferase family 2 protein [Chloroflexota bacterium]
MTPSAGDISVVMCAYTEDRWDDMCAGVDALRRQTLPAREIIVVIDHNPALFQRTRAHMPDITVIENTETRGLSGARNSGIAVASGSIIAFIDEDAVADRQWLSYIHAGFADPQVMGVGGSIEPMWQTGRPGWFPAEFDWVVGCTYRGMPQTTAQVRNLIGCNMAFRREIFDNVGGFRNGIGRVGKRPVGCEETELCIRVNQRWPGSIMLYEPRARVAHRVPISRANWDYFRSRCYSEGLSKALVTNLVGAQDGLSSERTYTMRTLPQGVFRGIANTLKGNPAGIQQSGAITLGLALTAFGYLKGKYVERSSISHTPTTEQNTVRHESAS